MTEQMRQDMARRIRLSRLRAEAEHLQWVQSMLALDPDVPQSDIDRVGIDRLILDLNISALEAVGEA